MTAPEISKRSPAECIHLPELYQRRCLRRATPTQKIIINVLCQTGSASASMGVILKAQFQPKNPTLSKRGSVKLT
ncbi:MAG TPA: hypothetical protein VE944_22055 [Nostoc sp.]|uniref:hypothetical protein n=1 Tax=Nostoc sp. TaxID=1180 RepID=UPI002D49CEBC|nr:hypothetical protein [Nostoc sp.]HYX16984.1 hypothetical protein [Nostoc sp.]